MASNLGYVLEPPRLSASNSPFTSSPNVVVLDSTAYAGVYPDGAEPTPSVQYFVTVVPDGSTVDNRFLVDARFGWTKNEGTLTQDYQRFGYDDTRQAFRLLPGARADLLGVVGPDTNTKRLKITLPKLPSTVAPYRLSCGDIGSGAELTLSFVTAFGSPPPLTVEVLTSDGTLNWNEQDLVDFAGQIVRYQGQIFSDYTKSTGFIGTVAEAAYLVDATAKGVLLSPRPMSGQFPMVRLGQGLWLTPIEVTLDSDLSSEPPSGSFKWSNTGLLRFNAADIAYYAGSDVFYDGVLMQYGVQLPRQYVGTVSSPTNIASMPPVGGDLIFRLPSENYQFAAYKLVTDFTSGDSGVVEVKSNGTISFSSADKFRYGASSVQVVLGDLPIERGIGFRLFRSLVNPAATSESPADVALFYTVAEDNRATLAKPAIAAPNVILPSLPIQGSAFPIIVMSEPNNGTYEGPLNDLSSMVVGSPTDVPGLGYVLDYSAKQLKFGNRRIAPNVDVLLAEPAGALQLPDPLLLGTNYKFWLERAAGSDVYSELTANQDYLLDPTTGMLTFTHTSGVGVATGTGVFSGTTFSDIASTQTTEVGDLLVVETGLNKGVYRVGAGSLASGVAIDVTTAQYGTNVTYTIRRNPEIVADRYWKAANLADPATMVERLLPLGTAQNESVLLSSALGIFTQATTFSDASVNFLDSGVRVGDTLILDSGPTVGWASTVTVVQQTSLTLASSTTDLSVDAKQYRVVRRLRVNDLSRTFRIRYGADFFSLPATRVATDADFTPATSLPPTSVEVSATTGNLNFPHGVLGQTAYWSRQMAEGVDYLVQPSIGFLDFTDRFLATEECLVTYYAASDTGERLQRLEERVSFQVREQTPPRTEITNVISFNPLGRTIAATPAPVVFRGGRPQSDTQAVVDLVLSVVQFLPDTSYMTDLFPHGERVGTDERIYVNYNVYEALGGEKSVTLSHPMYLSKVKTLADTSSFLVGGNKTADFPAGYLLRFDRSQIYSVGSATYPAGDGDQTEVTLGLGQTFLDDLNDPALQIVSGGVVPTEFRPDYFVVETAPYQKVSRGMNVLKVFGDVRTLYPKGTVLLFTDDTTYMEYYLVGSSELKGDWTSIGLAGNTRREYAAGQAFLKRTLRPVLEDGVVAGTLVRTPVLTQPYGVYRVQAGSVGQILASPTDYTVDQSGAFKYPVPIAPDEEIGVWYTGNQYTAAGTRLQATYSHSVVPSQDNGLLGQTVTMAYTVWSPDSFFFRVERLSKFKNEVSGYLKTQAQGSSQSSGPRTSNVAGSDGLYSKGNPSAYYDEGHITNQDLVARRYLQLFNDLVNELEDVLQSIDGRLVGADSGRFRFDGQTNNPVRNSYAEVTNDIDDPIKIKKRVRRMYAAHNLSRLYPTRKASLFGLTTAGADTKAVDDDDILDFGQTEMTGGGGYARRRLPRGLVTQTVPVNSNTIPLDTTQSTTAFLRPAFSAGMNLMVQAADGTVLGGVDGNPIVVSSVQPTSLTLQNALTFEVPQGSTVTLCTRKGTGIAPSNNVDTVYYKSYKIGWDVGLNLEEGVLTYVEPFLFPSQQPNSGECLQISATIRNVLKAPFRFPALDGLAENDTHDTGLPMKIRTFDCEGTYLTNEKALLDTFSINYYYTATTIPNVTVSNPARTQLTAVTPNWPAMNLRVYDLVRFVSGPNAVTGYRRIIALTANTLTVDYPFPFTGVGNLIVTSTPTDVATGNCTFLGALDIQVPSSAPIAVGQTVIFTTAGHVNEGVRRQVVARPSATQVTLDAPVQVTPTPCAYRVSNHLNTYSGYTGLIGALDQTLGPVSTNVRPTKANSEILGLQRFFDGDGVHAGILTTLLSGSASVTASSDVLTDTASDFTDVTKTNFIYVETGANRGFYKVSQVTDTQNLKVSPVFPATGTIQYRVVSSYSVNYEGLQGLFSVLSTTQDWASAADTWRAKLNSKVLVGVDANVYANDFTPSIFTDRSTAIQARQAYLESATGPTFEVSQTLGGRDQLYNKRYTWIDGRANIQTGFLYQVTRAVMRRIEQAEQQRNDLIKMLSM